MRRRGPGTAPATSGTMPQEPPIPKREDGSVENVNCPKCGHQGAEQPICPNCGHAASNGAVQPLKGPVQKPLPPPEVVEWVIEKTPSDEIEEALGPFNLEAFMAD